MSNLMSNLKEKKDLRVKSGIKIRPLTLMFCVLGFHKQKLVKKAEKIDK